MKPTVPIDVSVYRSEDGECPFEIWLDELDTKSRARLLARIARVRTGNLGDWDSIKGSNGVAELREHFGPGYRIYFAREGQHVILLLCGSTNSGQKKAIRAATDFLADWKNRNHLSKRSL